MQILMTLFLLIHRPALRNFTSIYSYSRAEYNLYYEFYRDIKYQYLDDVNRGIQLRHVKRDSLHANWEYDKDINIHIPIHYMYIFNYLIIQLYNTVLY